jgi:phosphopantothenoylcysteine decarboxylase/phosphopantothenate--cysteine ligase
VKKKKIRILISAGPTREPIDPVRFISNYSTGTLGFQMASLAKKRGHEVTLVSGPTYLKKPAGVRIKRIETALEMKKVLLKEFKKNDCLIMNVAVCDYRPFRISKRKIKKANRIFNLKLIRNPDILKELSRYKKDKLLIGFAIETQNLSKNALRKLKEKNLDLIVASEINQINWPFGWGKISAYIFDSEGQCQKMTNVTKTELSQKLLDRVEGLWYTSTQK